MEPLDLNQLPLWSRWPARMLEAEAWTQVNRTLDKVEAEYDKDKYAKCLQALQRSADRQWSAEDMVRVEYGEYGMTEETTICVSKGDDLYTTSLSEARRVYYELLARHLAREITAAKGIVELGCGYGFNLWWLSKRFPGKRWYGGEYSESAVELARALYGHDGGIDVRKFNFYDSSYPILDDVAGPMLVFTSHAVEQLPSAACVVAALAAYANRISAVVHFEPGYETHSDGLLGLMRRRYAEINDYNRDLVSLLRSRSDVQISVLEPDVFGLNPLNPSTVIGWHFAR